MCMKQMYLLPQTEIIPHITLECIQGTTVKEDKYIGVGEEPI